MLSKGVNKVVMMENVVAITKKHGKPESVEIQKTTSDSYLILKYKNKTFTVNQATYYETAQFYKEVVDKYLSKYSD